MPSLSAGYRWASESPWCPPVEQPVKYNRLQISQRGKAHGFRVKVRREPRSFA